MQNIKRFDFTKKVKKPFAPLLFIAKKIVAQPNVNKRKHSFKFVDMQNVKQPYLLLSNHASEIDFYILFSMFRKEKFCPVVALDAFLDKSELLMRSAGCICKRKFINDFFLLRNMKYAVDELKCNILLYPEARYSLDGTNSYIPESVGKLVKFLKVPVVTLNCQGNYVAWPQWNKIKRNNTPVSATATQIVTAEEARTLSAKEIHSRIISALTYDDFSWQKENGVVIDDDDRATGLDNILYKCPHCNAEFEMHAEGSKLWCGKCGKKYEFTPLGELVAEEGETEFSHVPDWFKWERQCVRDEVRGGTYYFEDDVETMTMPNAKRTEHLGTGKLIQTPEYTYIKVPYYNGETFELKRMGAEQESVHVEYNYKKKGYDRFIISVDDESFWLGLSKRINLTKLSIATEEIHFFALEKIQAQTASV